MSLEKPQIPEKAKKIKPSRTIDTMFRTTMSNHVHLTMLADRKAALMISINSIIISVMMSFLFNKFDANPQLLLPTALMAGVSLLTITFAVLSTRPTIKPRSATAPTGNSDSLDLLFFGDYLSLSPEDYRMKMKELITSDDKLHDSLIDNIYIQGQVIGRKFRLLAVAYNVFMYGFPVVIIIYLLAMYLS